MIEKAKPSCRRENFALSSSLISFAEAMASIERRKPRTRHPVFGVFVNCSAFSPGECHRAFDPSGRERHFAHLADHGIRAVERGALRAA
jgi:hypothetical protein